MSYIFEWDEEKATSNKIKHGISFDEASSVFEDFYAKIMFDFEHSITEDRYFIIGYSINNRLLFTSFTQRNEAIRIISTRKTSKKEKELYEKNSEKY